MVGPRICRAAMLAVAFAFVLTRADVCRAETLDELYAKAKAEKDLVLYTGGPVAPPPGFAPLTSYKLANAYREFVTDAALIADLRKRFEAYTGPPVNKGGVR